MNRLFLSFLLVAFLSGISACNKALDEPIRSVSNGMRDSASDIRTVLGASPFHLFNQAFQRLKLDSAFGVYTILAPTDSVMQAAGLTSSVIDALSIDSLYKIVAYHTLFNTYNDSVLENSPMSLQAKTLRQDVYYNQAQNSPGTLIAQTLQQSLYIWKKGVLYVNGAPANNGELPLRARNGWIWPVNRLITAPRNTTWEIIQSRPELSMYRTAYQLIDSFYRQTGFYIVYWDTALFSIPAYQNTIIYGSANYTFFAPTNNAFARAGFNTVDDIRQYVVKAVPGRDNHNSTGVSYNYIAMDSVLKEHFLGGVNTLMYQDLLTPAVNNGWSNTNSWMVTAYQAAPWINPYYPQFSGHNGTVNIQYSRDPSVPPAVLPPDKASYLAVNGIVYEVDQLFYPHN